MRRTLFDDTHEQFRASVLGFIQRHVAPHVEEWERDGLVDKGLYPKAGAAGLMGLYIPEELGGGGTNDFRYEAIIGEEFARLGMMGAGAGIINHQIPVAYMIRLATEEQRSRWFPGLATGELLATMAMTEPGTGSDLSGITTRAERDGSDWIITGSKMFISSGILNDLVIVVCRTEDGARAHHNLSLIVVEDGTAGYSRGRNLDKIGWHAADTAELFDDVRVPAENLLGTEDRGFFHLVQNLPSERLGIANLALAHAQGVFDSTLEYARGRKAFGQTIASFQNSRFAFATMRTELDVAQVFVDRQIEAFNAGELSADDAAQAKWWCTDVNKRVLDQCLQLHGGYGYMEEYPVARAWRDGRVMSIFGGTNEIMKDLIGRRLAGD